MITGVATIKNTFGTFDKFKNNCINKIKMLKC